MKAFYFPTGPDSAWLDRALPGLNPAELPLAGRQFIDYELEAADRFGVDSAVVVNRRLSYALGHRFDGDRDGLCSVSHRPCEGDVPHSLSAVGEQPWFREETADGAPVAVVWGQCLPLCGPEEADYAPVPEEDLRKTPTGLYRFAGGRWTRPVSGVFPVCDTASWLELSMRLLDGCGGFTLPGYSGEKGVHICRNVVMELGTEARPPVLLLDNVWCDRNVRLERVVLGADAFVGEGARLSRTVVCDGTFVGEGLELEGKIVAGRRVIDAATGTWVDIEEPGVVSGVARAPRWRRARLVARSVARFIAGASMRRRV